MAEKESPSLMGRIKSAFRNDQAEARSLAEEADRNDARSVERVGDVVRKARRAVKRYRQRRSGRTL
jgi:hypothetical protein